MLKYLKSKSTESGILTNFSLNEDIIERSHKYPICCLVSSEPNRRMFTMLTSSQPGSAAQNKFAGEFQNKNPQFEEFQVVNLFKSSNRKILSILDNHRKQVLFSVL